MGLDFTKSTTQAAPAPEEPTELAVQEYDIVALSLIHI